MNTWETCPRCLGKGTISEYDPLSLRVSTHLECPVCKGEMIISKITGRPPINIHPTANPYQVTFKQDNPTTWT